MPAATTPSSPTALPAFRPACSLGRLVLGPALLTLAVTLLRLILEGVRAPAWLASREAGGQGALIGIAWLPLLFGPWFAARLRRPGDSSWALLKRLLKTLVVYGWSARAPVVVITFFALGFGWDTHFNKFGPANKPIDLPVAISGTLGAQLIFWSVIWTPIVGGLAGLVFHWFTRGNVARAGGSLDRPLEAA